MNLNFLDPQRSSTDVEMGTEERQRLQRQLEEQLAPWRHCRRWWLGYSGGLDSTVLLDLLCRYYARADGSDNLPELWLIHVNHQLQDEAGSWSEHCQQVSRHRGLPLVLAAVDVNRGGRGLEAAARDARYQVFERHIQDADLLLLAHHLDDQVETFFLRLLRGAGTVGLSAMPAQRRLGQGQLLRPLLAVARADLEGYARHHQLEWVEDDSNTNATLDRNFLRQQVMPLVEQRWPAYRQVVEAARTAISNSEILLQESDRARLQERRGQRFGEPVLELRSREVAGDGRLSRLLRAWLAELGLELPGRRSLEAFVTQTAQPSAASPLLQGRGYQLRRFRDCVHVLADPNPPLQQTIAWDGLAPLTVEGMGTLKLQPVHGGGLRARPDRVCFRRGGERLLPAGRGHSQLLKKLLQEEAVPPWWRDRLPLLYLGDRLIAVANLWVSEGFQAKSGQEGHVVHWTRPAPVSRNV